MFWVLSVGLNECKKFIVDVMVSGLAESHNLFSAGHDAIKGVMILQIGWSGKVFAVLSAGLTADAAKATKEDRGGEWISIFIRDDET